MQLATKLKSAVLGNSSHLIPLAGAHIATCEWRHLAFLNYRVSPELLQPLLPQGTELDLWEGSPWMSLVSLTFKNTKALGIPVPTQQDYEQINLRFYVRRREGPGWKGGVVFIREIVPKPLFSFLVRVFYGENYVSRPTHRRIGIAGRTIHFSYSWGNEPSINLVRGITPMDFTRMEPESHEEFIAHRLSAFTLHKGGSVSELHIDHPRWLVSQIQDVTFSLHETNLFGEDLSKILMSPPSTAFFAVGSEVQLFLPEAVSE